MKGINILNSCTYYSVDISNFKKELKDKLIYELGLNGDETFITLDLDTIYDWDIPLEAVNWDTEDIDEVELEELLLDLIGKFPYYLVFAQHCTWNGSSGYAFVEDIKKTVYRNDEANIVLNEEGKGCIKCTESSHDVPGGQPTYIIGLTEKEYNKVKKMSFEEVEQYAISKF